jgi:Cu/Ag efflux pump CusA
LGGHRAPDRTTLLASMRAALLLLILALQGCKGASHEAAAPVVIVSAAEGLSADDVERQVTLPLERALASHAREVRSASMTGVSRVVVRMGGPPGQAGQARQEAISALADAVLPQGVSPTLMPQASGAPPIRYLLHSQQLPRADLRALQDWELERLERSTPGVVDAEACGGSSREVRVEVDMQRLSAHHASLAEVMGALARTGTSAPGSSSAFGLRRTQASVEDLMRGPATLREGLSLQDVATVALSPASETCTVEADGEENVVEGVVRLRKDEDWPAVEQKIRPVVEQRGVDLRLWPPASAARVLQFRVGLSAQLAHGEGVGAARALSALLKKRTEVASVLVETRAGLDLEDALPGEVQVLVALKPRGGLAGFLDSGEDVERQLASALRGAVGVRYVLTQATPRVLLFGSELEHLERTASQLAEALAGGEGFKVSVLSEHAPTLRITPDRTALARYGLSQGEVADLIAVAIGGRVVSQALQGTTIVDVRATLLHSDAAPDKLIGIPVALPDGGQVPLGQLARFERVSSPAFIQRKDGQRFVELAVEASPDTWRAVAGQARRRVAAKVQLAPGEHIEWPVER